MTLRLYAGKKGWNLESVDVELSHERVHARDCEECEENDNVMIDLIRRNIEVPGDWDEDQGARLLALANRCPVHRTLEGGTTIVSKLEVVRKC